MAIVAHVVPYLGWFSGFVPTLAWLCSVGGGFTLFLCFARCGPRPRSWWPSASLPMPRGVDGFTRGGLRMVADCVFLSALHFFTRRNINRRRAIMNGRFAIDLHLRISVQHTTRASSMTSAIDCTSMRATIGTRVSVPSGLLRRMYKQVVGQLFRSFPRVRRVALGLTGHGPPVNTSVRTTKIRVYRHHKR